MSADDDIGPLEGSKFWIGPDIQGSARKKLMKIVRMQGGLIVDASQENDTHLLYKDAASVDPAVVGVPVRSAWITESMDSGELLEMENYVISRKRKRKRKATSSSRREDSVFAAPTGGVLTDLDEYVMSHVSHGVDADSDDVWRGVFDAIPALSGSSSELRKWYVNERFPQLRAQSAPTSQSAPAASATPVARGRAVTTSRPKSAATTPEAKATPKLPANHTPSSLPTPKLPTNPTPNPNPTTPTSSAMNARHDFIPPPYHNPSTVNDNSVNLENRNLNQYSLEERELLNAMERVSGKPMACVIYALMCASGRVGVALDALSANSVDNLWLPRDDEGLLEPNEEVRKGMCDELVHKFGYPMYEARLQFLDS